MKKTLLTVSLLLVCCWFCGYGQTPDWVWARGAISSTVAEGYSIATDNSSNVFVTGMYGGSITFGAYVLSVQQGVFLAKYDAYGNVKWAKGNLGGTANGFCVATDPSGNSYITGYFTGSVLFDNHLLVSLGTGNVFIVKYDPSGNVLWAKSAGGTGGDIGYGVTTDASGNIYLTGSFLSPSFVIGPYTLINSGGLDVFLAKYDSSGNVLWAKSATGNNYDYGYSIATDALANVFVTGYFNSASLTFGSYTLTLAGSQNVFLAKYDSSGNILWVRSNSGIAGASSNNVTTDKTNNAYITGSYSTPSITFGPTTLTNSGSRDCFLAKYDPSGNVLWAKKMGGTKDDQAWGVSTDKRNNVYVIGGFTSVSIAVDSITLLPPPGSTDPMFISEYDSSGHLLFTKTATSGGDDMNSISISPSGCIYVGGDYAPSIFILGDDTLMSSTGAENIFVAKLCDGGLMANFTSSDTTFCTETSKCINFNDQSYGNPTSWHWHFTGATPDTSTQQNPTNICYGAPGTYPVSLVVKNSSGSDSLTVASMIIVASPPLPPVVTVVGGDTLYSSHGSHYQWYLNGVVIGGATDSFCVAHQGGTYSVQVTDQYGCQSTSAGTQVGIDELSGGVGVAVYPNPFSDELTASPRSASGGRGEWEFTLFDITSRVLLRSVWSPSDRSFTNQTTINTEHLARGIYFYEVTDKNGGVARGKVVKE